MIRQAALISVCVALAFPAPRRALAQASNPVVIADTPECPACRIELVHVVTLGDDSSAGFVGSTFHVTRFHAEYLVTIREAPSEIRTYSTSGRFLRVRGRRGGGPGEFDGINGIQPTADGSLLVTDNVAGRVTVFSPSWDLELSFPLPVVPYDKGVIKLGSGEFVVNGVKPSSDLVGLPLHVLSPTGERVRSFGYEGVVGPDEAVGRAAIRWLAPATGAPAEFWSVPLEDYELERWNTQGDRLQAVRRSARWFTRERGAQILDVAQASSGHLTILGRVSTPATESGERAREDTSDLVLEILDPQLGTLVATQKFPHFGVRLLDHEHLVTYREGDARIPLPRLDVWRIVLRR